MRIHKNNGNGKATTTTNIVCKNAYSKIHIEKANETKLMESKMDFTKQKTKHKKSFKKKAEGEK